VLLPAHDRSSNLNLTPTSSVSSLRVRLVYRRPGGSDRGGRQLRVESFCPSWEEPLEALESMQEMGVHPSWTRALSQ
jgi:hypothetical protein